MPVHLIRHYWLTILLTSSVEPGSTEQTDASELEADACDMSSRYSGVA